MAQMATVGEVKTHETVVRAHKSLVDLQVGGTSTQTLDVDAPLLGVKVERLQGTSLAGELNGIDVLVTTIITSAGVTLGVLVGHGRAQGVENGMGGEVLRGDQDDGFALTLDFFLL